jgi:hypothetical protein
MSGYSLIECKGIVPSLPYYTTFTLIILFSEMLKFSNFFSNNKIMWIKLLNLQEYFIWKNEFF